MQKKKTVTNKGITLIALIITIIVMLILVGVSVNVALNGGLFEAAQTTASETEKAANKEKLSIVLVSMNADIIANPEKYNFNPETTDPITLVTEILTEEGFGDVELVSVDDENFILVYKATYNEEEVVLSIQLQQKDENTLQITSIEEAEILSIEEVISSINAEIAANPSDWQALDGSTGEDVAILRETFAKYAIDVDISDNTLTEGTVTTLVFNSATYYGEAIKIAVTAQNNAEDSTLKDITGMSIVE